MARLSEPISWRPARPIRNQTQQQSSYRKELGCERLTLHLASVCGLRPLAVVSDIWQLPAQFH